MKRHRVDDKTTSERVLWSHEHGFCWVCGRTQNLHTHEIVRRSESAKALNLKNYARLCDMHHEEAHGGWLTKGILLTLKAIWDGANYDPQWIRDHAIAHHHEAEALPDTIKLTHTSGYR